MNNDTDTFNKGNWTLVSVVQLDIKYVTRYGDLRVPQFRYPTHKEINQYEGWCKEHIGNEWTVRNSYWYYFKKSEDALAFKLTFGIR